jgi:transposase
MDASEKLKRDVREGRIDPERLIDLIVDLQRELQKAKQRIEELEKKLGAATTAKTDEPFSMRSEEKRQEQRGQNKKKKKPKGRRGRITTAEKIALAKRTERVFPADIPESDCRLSHVRPVWRLEENRAVLIAYEIYRGPRNQYGIIPGVLGRSEFGQEIVVAVAYLVFITGLSFDKVCLVFNFFQELPLRKSQVDALLRQLSRHWEHEFDVLSALLANSAVVHADETSWSLNSVWAFVSEQARVLWFGVHKDADTLQRILDPATFDGIVISDDAAVYADFSASQKCWAHLLRKAIKLTLQEPLNATYRDFTDRLLQIYRVACRVQRDRRLSDAGRLRKVADLEGEVGELCQPMWCVKGPPAEGLANDYRLLVNELGRLVLAEQLFTFVTAPPVTQPNGQCQPVAGTNNEAERTLRPAAEARNTGRTSKTFRGARRQTILTSVLQSLRVYLPTFTLATVSAEISRWARAGQSCFEDLLAKLEIPLPEESLLDFLLPHPSD